MSKKQTATASRKRAASATTIRAVELFAGVGGFRIGLENANKELRDEGFKVVWSNQWEPATKRQHASEVYEARWGKECHSNEDIAKVVEDKVHLKDFELVVGGFPCQDYSVARTLSQAAGLQGKKGVLWWQIHNILRIYRPPYGLFENVDRLLKSPANQRGRDFAVMLASLAEIGYCAEWRVINSAEYGFPQRRKRVFILVYRSGTPLARAAKKQQSSWLTESGVLAEALPCGPHQPDLLGAVHRTYKLEGSLADITEKFNNRGEIHTPFENAGMLLDRVVHTLKTIPTYKGPFLNLGDILQPAQLVAPEFCVDPKDIPDWRYLKGAKKEPRTKSNGVEYSYNEGRIAFPDLLDRPSRTIITAEGGATPSRFKHIILLPDGRWRRLTPVELERLNGFPDDHTKHDGISDAKRAFFMGNALVTGIVTRIGVKLARRIVR